MWLFYRFVFLYTLLATSVALGSCGLFDPKGETLVEGQVVERNSHQPVPGAKLRLIRGGTTSTGGSYLSEEYEADAQGKFSFRFSGEEGKEYQLDATAAPGYFADPSERPDLRGGRRNKDVTAPVYAPAWVCIRLRDEPPRTLVRTQVWGYPGRDYPFYHPRDTTYVRAVLPHTPITIYCLVTLDSNGAEVRHERPITPTPLDTVDVTFAF